MRSGQHTALLDQVRGGSAEAFRVFVSAKVGRAPMQKVRLGSNVVSFRNVPQI